MILAVASPLRKSIPACAGEPRTITQQPRRRWVYPRVCGGARPCHHVQSVHIGLSPRVRGSRGDSWVTPASRRSIPACAGEPCVCARPRGPAPVYPRVCGGARRLRLRSLGGGGLSPRVRGSLQQCRRAPRIRWSIPACAGEPPQIPLSSLWREVYPRVCGGASLARMNDSGSSGLSPRVRGSRLSTKTWSPIERSIPACAGEPGAPTTSWSRSRVYPRVCGGAGIHLVYRSTGIGLSPRVRGSRVRLGR